MILSIVMIEPLRFVVQDMNSTVLAVILWMRFPKVRHEDSKILIRESSDQFESNSRIDGTLRLCVYLIILKEKKK